MTRHPKPGAPDTDSVAEMFDSVAPVYDRMNRLLSLGLDKYWRRRAVSAVLADPVRHILDLATGTADLPLALIAENPDVTVTGVDYAAEMLRIGEQKLRSGRGDKRITLARGDVHKLPFTNACCDAVTSAFGLRNFTDRPQFWRETYRVLNPGGRIVILELTEPCSGVLRILYRLVLRTWVSLVGGAAAGRQNAYHYLAQSIMCFPDAAEICAELRDAGFSEVNFSSLAAGTATIWVAVKAG